MNAVSYSIFKHRVGTSVNESDLVRLKISKKIQHIVPHPDGWTVKGEGNQRATSVHPTQREAIETARDIAGNQRSGLFIHGENGRIRERNTYGDAPYLPKG